MVLSAHFILRCDHMSPTRLWFFSLRQIFTMVHHWFIALYLQCCGTILVLSISLLMICHLVITNNICTVVHRARLMNGFQNMWGWWESWHVVQFYMRTHHTVELQIPDGTPMFVSLDHFAPYKLQCIIKKGDTQLVRSDLISPTPSQKKLKI